jgi:hypothetical protein
MRGTASKSCSRRTNRLAQAARAAAAAAVCAAWLAPGVAHADTMDPALERLVLDSSCQVTTGSGIHVNPANGSKQCTPDNAAFAKLIAQYGFAIAPTAMHSARTTGYGGFELAIEAAYTGIDSGADYWKKGTQGPKDPVSNKFSDHNDSPSSMLQAYSLKIRKGFPFGLEITGDVGYLAQTSLVFGGADVRLSLFEGFRTGIPAIFPEVAVGGSIRSVAGTPEFQLTVAGFDAIISKPLPIAGSVVFTPYVGYQWIRIFGDSGLIDFTPNTDAVNYCGYTGINTPANRDPTKKVSDGQPVCSYGSSADFNNQAVFDPVRLTRHRIVFGGQLRFQVLRFGIHSDIDLVSPESANKGSDEEINGVNKFSGVKSQYTLAFDLGAIF